jgi:hypothetical protein
LHVDRLVASRDLITTLDMSILDMILKSDGFSDDREEVDTRALTKKRILVDIESSKCSVLMLI